MHQTIKIEICCGTTCYMLGGADLLKLEDLIPAHWIPKVNICAIPCMDFCTREDLGKAPFVKINDKIIANASVETVMTELTTLIENTEEK